MRFSGTSALSWILRLIPFVIALYFSLIMRMYLQWGIFAGFVYATTWCVRKECRGWEGCGMKGKAINALSWVDYFSAIRGWRSNIMDTVCCQAGLIRWERYHAQVLIPGDCCMETAFRTVQLCFRPIWMRKHSLGWEEPDSLDPNFHKAGPSMDKWQGDQGTAWYSSIKQLLKEDMETDEKLVCISSWCPAVDIWIAWTAAFLDLDELFSKWSYLPISDGQILLTGNGCPSHSGDIDFEVQEVESPGELQIR